MDEMVYTCPDCCKVVRLDTTNLPQEQLAKIDVVFKDWMNRIGWKFVRCGIFNISRKWVCDNCKHHYS